MEPFVFNNKMVEVEQSELRRRERIIFAKEQVLGIGTALAFMMSVTALSLPSLIMLKKVVKIMEEIYYDN